MTRYSHDSQEQFGISKVLLVFEKFTRAYLCQIAVEKLCDYLRVL